MSKKFQHVLWLTKFLVRAQFSHASDGPLNDVRMIVTDIWILLGSCMQLFILNSIEIFISHFVVIFSSFIID